jgi:hypothetical protein
MEPDQRARSARASTLPISSDEELRAPENPAHVRSERRARHRAIAIASTFNRIAPT